jgi:hypothetical protein
MIAFDLQCDEGHIFEGWFDSNEAFEEQKKKNLISCPICNSMDVTKILSPIAIKKGVQTRHDAPANHDQLTEISNKIIDYVEKNFDNVGCDFAKEALKIHYGATEPRNIRGVSTPAEEKVLTEEGIEFLKIPMPSRPDSET